MAVTLEQIESEIVKAIAKISGLLTINERNPGMRPVESYASYRTLAYEPLSFPDWRMAMQEDGFEETLIDVPLIQSSVKFVGKDAFSKLCRLVVLLRSANRDADLWAFVGLAGVEDVQNITTEFNSRQIEQAVVHINWYAEVEIKSDIDYFAQVPIEITGVSDEAINMTIPKEIIV